MIRTLLNLLEGWQRMTAAPQYATEVLNLLRENRFPHWRMRRGADGSVTFTMLYRDSLRCLALCRASGLTVEAGGVRGMPDLLHRYRGRWGLPVGAVCFALIVWLSVSVVWNVEISGNRQVSDARIREILQNCGFGEGSRFGNMDFDLFQNNVLLTTDEISWIAINMCGTTAQVEVRESRSGKDGMHAGAANIIASEDGQITEVHVSGGRAEVAIHDVVRKGDLLISGLMTIRGEELRYEYASGEVLAQVRRQIVTEIPLVQETKVSTGEKVEKKSLIFFGKEIKLFQNAGIEVPTYDTIIESVRVSLPGGLELPIWIRTETQRAYRTETETLTDAEAYALAQSQFKMAVGELLETVEILSLESTAALEDGVCRIVGDAVCITDIAETMEIPIS